MSSRSSACSLLFFFNDTPTTKIYTLSLHDALPILDALPVRREIDAVRRLDAIDDLHHLVGGGVDDVDVVAARHRRSEEHTSELQSLTNLVCRLLLEKKKNIARDVHGSRR